MYFQRLDVYALASLSEQQVKEHALLKLQPKQPGLVMLHEAPPTPVVEGVALLATGFDDGEADPFQDLEFE